MDHRHFFLSHLKDNISSFFFWVNYPPRCCMTHSGASDTIEKDWGRRHLAFCWRFSRTQYIKGGDPATRSRTATLLRLLVHQHATDKFLALLAKPWFDPLQLDAPMRVNSSRASPRLHSDGLTGGVCKEQGRIQRKISLLQAHHSAASPNLEIRNHSQTEAGMNSQPPILNHLPFPLTFIWTCTNDDLRLLGIPASRGRVAAPDPN